MTAIDNPWPTRIAGWVGAGAAILVIAAGCASSPLWSAVTGRDAPANRAECDAQVSARMDTAARAGDPERAMRIMFDGVEECDQRFP